MRDGRAAGAEHIQESVEGEWVSFPGGELEGPRPKGLCPACRLRAFRASASQGSGRLEATEHARSQPPVPGPEPPAPICFQCYRVDQARERALQAARNLNTASETRFQDSLPFEPVNRARLERLRVERALSKTGIARFADKRRHAQIAARHALDRIAAGLRSRGVGEPLRHPSTVARDALSEVEGRSAIADAIHAAELQLPEAWIPFVVSR
jgi:hypothetical protein